MKNLVKLVFLSLFISFLSVSCGSSGSGDKNKDTEGTDTTLVKTLKKDKDVEPSSGCD